MDEKTSQLNRLVSRVTLLSSHHVFFLLKNCLALSKLLYTLQCSPVWQFPQKLRDFDAVLRSSIVSVCNIRLDDAAWSQVSLPVRRGGLGIRRSEELALSAYLASAHSVSTTVLAINSTFNLQQTLAALETEWSTRATLHIPEADRRSYNETGTHRWWTSNSLDFLQPLISSRKPAFTQFHPWIRRMAQRTLRDRSGDLSERHLQCFGGTAVGSASLHPTRLRPVWMTRWPVRSSRAQLPIQRLTPQPTHRPERTTSQSLDIRGDPRRARSEGTGMVGR